MTNWQFSLKPTFLHELSAFEPKESAQILRKIDLLAQDPTPDAKTKKQLKGLGGKLHRLRSGDFRIFYMFQSPFVSLLSVKRRNKQTYADEVDVDDVEGAEVPDLDEHPSDKTWDQWLAQPPKKGTPLARTIDEPLLDALNIPAQFHTALAKVATEEELLDCAVPLDVLNKVIDAVTGRPIEQVAQQPDLLLNEPEDLLRYRDGELLGFLLKLSPEQEKLVGWALGGKGPTLLKGGPGSGKSTVALYRVREILRALRKAKVESPKVLFTTYTRALTRVSEQLLRTLIGAEDMKCVEVKTADSVLRQIAVSGGASSNLVDAKDLRVMLAKAIERATFEGSSLKVASQKEAVAKLSRDFLFEEIFTVIEGRGLSTLEGYMTAGRPGRRLALTKVQREAVWRVREALVVLLADANVSTIEGWRRCAAERVRSGEVAAVYDAVVIDEAQDLAPTVVAALVGLCKAPGGVFLAADANQSIYGAGFRWSDVHDWLKFQGRTGVLRANHRSTREIGEAANAYLRRGKGTELEEERTEAQYVHAGAIPAVRAVESPSDETKLLARFFRQASRSLRLGLGACAVLVPTNDAASRIASDLSHAGLTAKKVDANDLELTDPGVKVLTLKNAKGLEFPIVALAGFRDKTYPPTPPHATDEEREEIVERERRTMFVAMTRAMRALLVITPVETVSPLLEGLAPPGWNDGRDVQP
jgi:superfamily I DNA/RNA helicase/mRNA-degrading endonuclease RelE of RelBE toxin-antitoxin system